MVVMIYIYIKADGTTERISIDRPLDLKELQELVGGYIEFIHIDKKAICCDEEGKLKNKPVNKAYPMLVGDVVVGYMRKVSDIQGGSDMQFVGEERKVPR